MHRTHIYTHASKNLGLGELKRTSKAILCNGTISFPRTEWFFLHFCWLRSRHCSTQLLQLTFENYLLHLNLGQALSLPAQRPQRRHKTQAKEFFVWGSCSTQSVCSILSLQTISWESCPGCSNFLHQTPPHAMRWESLFLRETAAVCSMTSNCQPDSDRTIPQHLWRNSVPAMLLGFRFLVVLAWHLLRNFLKCSSRTSLVLCVLSLSSTCAANFVLGRPEQKPPSWIKSSFSDKYR